MILKWDYDDDEGYYSPKEMIIMTTKTLTSRWRDSVNRDDYAYRSGTGEDTA